MTYNGYETTGSMASSSEPLVNGARKEPSGEGFEVNFENAPVAAVAKVVLTDILGQGYLIDPRVQGTISLSTGRPIAKKEVLFAFENALRMNNAALIKDSSGYRIIPVGEAVGSGTVDRNAEPGYGLTILPLRFVSAQTMMKLMDSFAIKPGMIRADTTRNILLFQGTGTERRQALESALSFDADWMRGQSVGVYPVRNAAPETIITELEKIMETAEGGAGQNLVKFQPVGRLNAVLVVARKPELLRSSAIWIGRLDKSDTTASGIKVYRVRYGDAKQIAAVLNDALAGRSGGLDTSSNQIAPGAGISATRASGVGAGGAGLDSQSTGSTQSPFGSLNQGQSARTASLSGQQGTGFGEESGTFGRQGSNGASGGPGGAAGQAATSGTPGQGPLPGVRVTADVANNALLIYASRENFRVIERTLHELDRPQLQVAIDATIAEVTLNNTLNYGVQFYLRSTDLGLKANKGSLSLAGTAQAALSRSLPGSNLLLGSATSPDLVINALRDVTEVKVLSSPSLVVLDNQVASLQVGDQVPITTRTATVVESPNNTIVNNIEYRNTGVILRVAPRVNVNGNVMLDVEQEISNVTDNGQQQTLTPTVSERKIKSSIAVASGQTVLLGGLISDRQLGGTSGIPGLQHFFFLGDLLSNNTRGSARTELIIFIRPQIIRDGLDAQRVAEELRGKLSIPGEIRPPLIPAKLMPGGIPSLK